MHWTDSRVRLNIIIVCTVATDCIVFVCVFFFCVRDTAASRTVLSFE